MEVLTMLKHLRGGGGGGGGGGAARAPPVAPPYAAAATTTTTFASSALRPSTEAEDDDDDGPFFDLEFFVPDDGGESDGSSPESEQGYERGLKLAVGPGAGFRAGSIRSDPGLSLSPSDDLFFKGRVLPLDPASLLLASPKPSSRSKSGAKLRVFLLGFKKHKTGTAESDPKQQHERRRQSKFFVNFKAEDVPIVSLFTRDSSSRSRPAKLHPDDGSSSPGSEKRFSKDALHRYLTKIKRYAEKQHFNGKLSSTGTGSDVAGSKQSPSMPGNPKCQRPLGLREVCSRLGKSRSASSSVAAVRSPPILPPERRRDDSLLELQDGIQSAIAHCKRSFNAGTESTLVRCRSDPGDERSAPASSTVRSNF